MNRNSRLVFAGVLVVIVGGTALAALLSRDPEPVTGAAAATQEARAVDQAGAAMRADVLVRAYSPVLGPATAPVTIVEFFDPACEGCRAFHPHVKQILAADPARVRLVMRYVPLHGDISVEAVGILEAARAQDLFAPVLDALMTHQPQWASHSRPAPEQAWEAARGAGLDVEAARRQIASMDIGGLLAQEIADAKAVKLTGTPTFYVNGAPLEEAHPDALRELVVAAAAGGSPTP